MPKTVLVRQVGLTKLEQKLLANVSRIEHWATVQKSTTHILPHVDEDHDIQSVIFLRVELGRRSAYAEVSRLLHKCLPNPTVILTEGQDGCCVSVDVTRRSLAEHGATVVESVDSTGAFDPDDGAWVGLLDALAFRALPQEDLLAYLVAMERAVKMSRAIPVLGHYPGCGAEQADELLKLIAEYDRLTIEARGVEARRQDRNLSLNETAKLRMRQKSIEKDRDKVAEGIQKLCEASRTSDREGW